MRSTPSTSFSEYLPLKPHAIIPYHNLTFLILFWLNKSMIYTCDSCGIRTTNFTEFKCPKCGAIIRRCTECKSNMVKYTCKKCGFEGP
ncbi:MAG: zinc finger domain-containing protein [Candidatus Micrarchaeia archaeon]